MGWWSPVSLRSEQLLSGQTTRCTLLLVLLHSRGSFVIPWCSVCVLWPYVGYCWKYHMLLRCHIWYQNWQILLLSAEQLIHVSPDNFTISQQRCIRNWSRDLLYQSWYPFRSTSIVFSIDRVSCCKVALFCVFVMVGFLACLF